MFPPFRAAVLTCARARAPFVRRSSAASLRSLLAGPAAADDDDRASVFDDASDDDEEFDHEAANRLTSTALAFAFMRTAGDLVEPAEARGTLR